MSWSACQGALKASVNVVEETIGSSSITAAMKGISTVTVLYNSADVIAPRLASIPPDAEVIVVDNASGDHSIGRALRARPDATVIRSPVKLGFGGGCNLGWRRASHEVVAFINPDARLHPGALELLTKRLALEPHGMVGPVMYDASAVPRRCNRRPSVMYDALNILPSSTRWVPSRWDGKLDTADSVHREGGPVGYVEGACFVIRRANLEAIGGFDEDFFLYGEEASLALRLAKLGGRAVYEPAAAAEHGEADSTKQIGPAATRHFCRSRVLLYRKRDGELLGRFAAVLIGLCSMLALPAAAVNTILGRPRTRCLPYLWNVAQGLASGALYRPQSGLRYRSR